MLFSEIDFWLFFAVVFAAYLVLPHRLQNWLLLGASYVFYGSWDWRFLGLILFSTTTDFMLSHMIGRETEPLRRKNLLIAAIGVHLAMLATFKYLGFFVDSFSDLMLALGLSADPFTLSIILPVGISFFTFQAMSYNIDVWRGDLKPAQRFQDYALCVAFFPQLVAGPIVRAVDLLPQVEQPRRVTWKKLSSGTVLCLTGLIKKIVVADAVAPSVDAVFASSNPSGAEIAVGTWLFAIQIYADFSGYTDIARGVARMLGFELALNFAQPYFATNPQEFWRRWHISLSTWLRDYLYIPLGGSRRGRARTYVNLMTTMVLGGLWHGAAWNFLAWGAYQGALLSIHRAVAGRLPGGSGSGQSLRGTVVRVVSVVLFFQVVCYGWLLFRANSFGQIVTMTSQLAAINLAQFAALSVPAPPFPALVGIAAILVWDLCVELRGDERFYAAWAMPLRSATYAALIYVLAFGASTPSGNFIYFQF